MKTPVELCNDALRVMGLRTDCTNIDDPISQSDKVFSAYYAQTRRKLMKQVRPRFACVESFRLLGTPIDPADPKSAVKFLKPQDCLYIQKVNGSDNFSEYGREIVVSKVIENAIYLNYVRDVVDTGIWSDEFDELFSACLAKKCVQYLTKDSTAKQLADAEYATQLATFNALNARDTKIKKKHHNLTKAMWPFPRRY